MWIDVQKGVSSHRPKVSSSLCVLLLGPGVGWNEILLLSWLLSGISFLEMLLWRCLIETFGGSNFFPWIIELPSNLCFEDSNLSCVCLLTCECQPFISIATEASFSDHLIQISPIFLFWLGIDDIVDLQSVSFLSLDLRILIFVLFTSKPWLEDFDICLDYCWWSMFKCNRVVHAICLFMQLGLKCHPFWSFDCSLRILEYQPSAGKFRLQSPYPWIPTFCRDFVTLVI